MVQIPFETLKGLIFKSVVVDTGLYYIKFITNNSDIYRLEHYQNCCEDVHIEDIVGDVQDLVGVPIIEAYCESNINTAKISDEIWTFYRLSTIKGTVTIRWYQQNNSYYSVEVGLYKL